MGTGEFLRRAREKRDLSMRAVARILGKAHSYLGKVERNEISPSIETLEVLCKVYGVQPWEAVAGKTKQELFREILGQQAKEEDPVFQSLRKIAEQEGGLEQLKELVKFAKNDPANIRKAIQIVEIWNQQENK